MTGFSFNGVYAATSTPLTADLAPDTKALIDHIRDLLSRGCHGVAPLGTTGEAMSFSVKERKNILERIVASGIPTDSILIGTGAASTEDCIDLTHHALKHGVTQALVLPPFYYKGVPDDGLFAVYARLIEAINDPRLRIMLYHIPKVSQIALSHDLIARLTTAYPKTVIGIKDSSGVWENLEQMVAKFPGFAVTTGADPLMAQLMGIGGAGCITGNANLTPELLRKFYDMKSAEDTDLNKIIALRQLVTTSPQFPAVKHLIGHKRGGECWSRVRPPLMPLNEDQKEAVTTSFDAIFSD